MAEKVIDVRLFKEHRGLLYVLAGHTESQVDPAPWQFPRLFTVVGGGESSAVHRVKDMLCRVGVMEDDISLFLEIHEERRGESDLELDLLMKPSEFLDYPNEENLTWVPAAEFEPARALALRRQWEWVDVRGEEKHVQK